MNDSDLHLHCFDTVGWVTGRSYGLSKIIPTISDVVLKTCYPGTPGVIDGNNRPVKEQPNVVLVSGCSCIRI